MDKQKWVYTTIILTLTLVFLTAIYMPMYIQAYSDDYPEKTWNQSTLNKSQLSLLNEIWGTNITIGEYYELIYPELLTEMPPELREQIYNKTMEWPKKGKIEKFGGWKPITSATPE